MKLTQERTGIFLNCRTDKDIPGVMVKTYDNTTEDQIASNGTYHYIDDVLAYDVNVEQVVLNTRIRCEFSTSFPERTTMGIRQTDEKKHFYFPNGYIENISVNDEETMFIYRYPHADYYSFQGDELNLFGQYDATIRIPPVPEGTYEIRVGYAALSTRGIMQVYFDGQPQGIPLDMRLIATDREIGWVKDTGGKAIGRAHGGTRVTNS